MKEFKVGDEVIMKGRVVEVSPPHHGYPVSVLFDGYPKEEFMKFTKEGKYITAYPFVSLFHAQPTERLVEVRDYDDQEWVTRVFCKEIDGIYYTWVKATTLEEVKTSIGLNSWRKMREIPPKKRVTLAEIAEKFGVSVDEIEIGE
jgi:hypothetical protein